MVFTCFLQNEDLEKSKSFHRVAKGEFNTNKTLLIYLFIFYLLIFEGFPNRVLVYPDRGVSK